MSETHKQPADFRIDHNGAWFHDGAPIKRAALAKLFSDRALKIDEDGFYWLQTPYEKYAVEVEDVPFIAIDYNAQNNTITFRTNMDDQITLTPDTKWEIRNEIPYFEVRNGLFAKLSRSVFYNVIEEFDQAIEIGGQKFPLGDVNG